MTVQAQNLFVDNNNCIFNSVSDSLRMQALFPSGCPPGEGGIMWMTTDAALTFHPLSQWVD